MDSLNFESQKIALKQDSTGYVLTLRVHPDELPEEILRDFVGARYMVAMVRVNDDETVITYKNKVKQAGMLCKNRGYFGIFYKQINTLVKKLMKIFPQKHCMKFVVLTVELN